MTLTPRQSYTIQVIRGICIIAVVVTHSGPIGFPLVFYRPVINCAVGVFLFLSGLLSSAERWHPLKRISKVIFPYIVWTLIYAGIKYFNEPAKIPLDFLGKLFKGNATSTMYYVLVYCQFALLIPLIDKLARSRFKILGFLISPVEMIVMRYLPVLLGYENSEAVSIIMGISCLVWFTYFYTGYLLGNNLMEIKISNVVLVLALIASIVLESFETYLIYCTGDTDPGTQKKLTSLLTGFLFTLIFYRIIKSGKCPEIKSLHLLGDYSFGIYLCHIAFIYFMKFIPGYKDIFIFPVNSAIALLISLLFVVLIKKLLGKYSKYVI